MPNPEGIHARSRPILLALPLLILGSANVGAQNAVVRAQNSKEFVKRTSENDSAIIRAREFLENDGVRLGIVNALHWKSKEIDPPSLGDVKESGTGAIIIYTYHWARVNTRASGFDTVTFHCDSSGTIDGLMVHPPTGDAFKEFGAFLKEKEQEAIRYLIEQFARSEKEQKAGPPTELEKGLYDIAAFVLAQAIGTNPQGVLELALSKVFQFVYSSEGPILHGMDGFRFGLGKPEEYRRIGIEHSQLPEAVPKIAHEFAAAAGLPSTTEYAREAEAIASAASTCGQIRAHDAFMVTSSGGRGDENIAILGPDFRLCNGPQQLHPVLSDDGSLGPRPLLFSISPAGRGWRDAQGMLVEVHYLQRPSDPAHPENSAFATYGLFNAQLPQTATPCSRPPGGGTPPDQRWRQDGTNAIVRVRFDCEYAEIYDINSHLIVADLALMRHPGDAHKDSYKGAGLISACPSGTGKVEMLHWSNARIELKVEEPNMVDHLCGGIKSAHLIDALTHVDTIKVVLVPYSRSGLRCNRHLRVHLGEDALLNGKRRLRHGCPSPPYPIASS